jgi:SAM-dependent methyltransferase
MVDSKPTYTQGYHPTVTAAHARRTAEVDGAFVLTHLTPTSKILDVGCGPGTISMGFAKYVPEGSVTAIDVTEEVLSQAREHLSSQGAQPGNVKFERGNVLEGLKYPDESFDVIFTSQVLIHLPDPLKALREMRRVCKPNGIVCCREGDYPFRYYPYLPGIQLFTKYLYEMVHGQSTSYDHPDNPPHPSFTRTGSLVHVWGREVGFEPEKMIKGAKAVVSATEEERRAFAEPMIGRILKGGTGEKFMERGASVEHVQIIVEDFKKWMEDVDGWFCVVNCEVILRK